MTLRRVGGDGGVVASTAVGAGGGGGSVAAAGGRRRWGRRGARVLLVVLVGVAVVAVGVGWWLWWTRPLTRSAPLPAGVEKGNVVSMNSSIPPPETNEGELRWEDLRSERHEWIVELAWRNYRQNSDTPVRLHLGESVHIDGLGTLTLLGVDPAPLLRSYDAGGGGSRATFNLTVDPEVSLTR